MIICQSLAFDFIGFAKKYLSNLSSKEGYPPQSVVDDLEDKNFKNSQIGLLTIGQDSSISITDWGSVKPVPVNHSPASASSAKVVPGRNTPVPSEKLPQVSTVDAAARHGKEGPRFPSEQRQCHNPTSLAHKPHCQKNTKIVKKNTYRCTSTRMILCGCVLNLFKHHSFLPRLFDVPAAL